MKGSKHSIAGIDSVHYIGMFYDASDTNGMEVLDARDGTDTRMQRVYEHYEKVSATVLSVEVQVV